MMMQHALTTVDNPFDPFDEFDAWMEWDRSAGYNTSDYLGRIVITSEELPPALEAEAVSQAIDEVLQLHGDTFYKKLSRDDAAPSAA